MFKNIAVTVASSLLTMWLWDKYKNGGDSNA